MARHRYVHVSAYRRRYPTLGEAITSTSRTNPDGPRLWSGNAADPQTVPSGGGPIMVKNAPKSDDTWLWVLALLMLRRK